MVGLQESYIYKYIYMYQGMEALRWSSILLPSPPAEFGPRETSATRMVLHAQAVGFSSARIRRQI